MNLIEAYANREEIAEDQAEIDLSKIAKDFEDPTEFLDEIGLEHDYIFDALDLMGL